MNILMYLMYNRERFLRFWDRKNVGVYDAIGQRVIQGMKNSGLTCEGLAKKMAEEGFVGTQRRASSFIADIRRGGVGGLIIPSSKNYTVHKYLERLAYIFSEVGIQEEEDAVQIIKKDNPDFEYPIARVP